MSKSIVGYGHVTGVPVETQTRLLASEKAGNATSRRKKNDERAISLALRILEHVRLAPKVTEVVKRKFRLAVKVLQQGGLAKVFRQNFSVSEGEKLLKVSQCHLYTTAGPIAGLLFISNEKNAFCSERSIKIPSETGDHIKIHYKVVIPFEKIQKTSKSYSRDRPSKKYLEIVTVDDFEFWFMGLLDFHRTLEFLQRQSGKHFNKHLCQ